MNPHLTDILAIIEGGVRGDPARVRTYAEELAKKIAVDGDRPAAERIRRAAASPKSMVASAAATVGAPPGTPTDGESRLPLADVERVEPSGVFFACDAPTQELLTEFIASVRALPRLRAHGFLTVPSLLAYGPPGCGKTQLARWVAGELRLPLVTARVDSLISSYLGSTAKNIRQLFEYAASVPCVLFLDEFDALAKLRDDEHELGELKRVVVSLLQNLDMLPPDTVVLAATNHEHLLDSAVWRRFHWKVTLPPPEPEVRARLLANVLGSDFEESLLCTASALVHGLSGADIRRVAETAKRRALIGGLESVPEALLFRAILEARNVPVIHSSDDSLRVGLRKARDLAPKVFTVRRLAEVFGVSSGKVQRELEKQD